MAFEDQAPQFIDEVKALGSTHAERAAKLNLHENWVIKMMTQRIIPTCISRYLPYPNVIAALHRDSLALQAKKRNDSPS